VSEVGGGQDLGASGLDGYGAAVVDVGGGVQAEAAVMVLVVVPGKKSWQCARAASSEVMFRLTPPPPGQVAWVDREDLGSYSMDRSVRVRIGHYLQEPRGREATRWLPVSLPRITWSVILS
jgi:hypothetical protein